jgi:hypothetical protein
LRSLTVSLLAAEAERIAAAVQAGAGGPKPSNENLRRKLGQLAGHYSWEQLANLVHYGGQRVSSRTPADVQAVVRQAQAAVAAAEHDGSSDAAMPQAPAATAKAITVLREQVEQARSDTHQREQAMRRVEG